MFSQSKKTVEITIGDGENDRSDPLTPPEKKSHHSSSLFLNPFAKKHQEDSSGMIRVKSAQLLKASNGDLDASFDSKGSSIQLNEKHKKTKQKLFGKFLHQTKSMPVIYKENEKPNENPNEELRKKHVKNNKSKLSQEGEKKLQELVSFLHKEPVVISKPLDYDDDDSDYTPGLGNSFDIDKYFEREEDNDLKTQWRSRFGNLNAKRRRSVNMVMQKEDLSENGYRLVRRFGQGIADGCGFPLSLKKDDATETEWDKVVEHADEALSHLESRSHTRGGRRGSIMQPRLLFVSPHPETGWDKVLQTGHCLPLRKWTSELFMASKEATTLLDPEMKRNLKWNASVEDFRHLLSPDLQYFSSDIDTDLALLVKTSKSQSTKANKKAITFRRQSCAESLWNADAVLSKRGDDYKERLEILRKHNADSSDGEIKFEKKQRLKPAFQPLRFALGDEDCLDCLSAQVLAIELTAIARELFLSLTPPEVSRLLLKPHLVNEESCPDITALLGFQKRIIHLFSTCIVDQTTIAGRAKRLAQFIEVAEELKHLRNWHSLFSVITSLQSLPVARLKLTWAYLANNYADHYCEYITLSELLKKDDLEEIDYTPPCIPLFDDWIHDLKIRCAIKIDSVRKQSTKGHWTRPENVASWVYGEIETLESLASRSHASSKKTKKNGKDKKSIFRRIKKNFSHKHSHADKVSIDEESQNANSTELRGTEDNKETHPKNEPTLQRASLNGSNLKKTEESFLIDFPDLKPEEEREILKEIAVGLKDYQNKALMYDIETNNEMAQNFLLYHSYNTMDTNMAKSIQLESSDHVTVTRL